MFIKVLALLFSAAVLLCGGWKMVASASEQLLVGQATVIDGDTLAIRGQSVTLYGIDAPELDQVCDYRGTRWLCGRKAALDLSAWLGQTTIVCRRRAGSGKHSTSSCTKGPSDVSGWSVKRGLAVTEPCGTSSYLDDQEAARASRAGIWASTFVLPRLWRHEHPRPLETFPESCP